MTADELLTKTDLEMVSSLKVELLDSIQSLLGGVGRGGKRSERQRGG